jgi:pyrroline-5-carboxylate reductase
MYTLPTIALIGAGNMGRGLISGLIHHGHPSHQIWAADPSVEKLAELKQAFSIETTSNNCNAVNAADIVILAIKPQMIPAVLPHMEAAFVHHQPVVISIAAGVRMVSLEHYLGKNIKIIRAMPNMPAVIGRGATGLYTAIHLTDQEKNWVDTIFEAVGVVKWLSDETQLDIVTALSGSGPAYFFLIFEALEKAASQLGLPIDIAHLFTLQTALGAAEMALKTQASLEVLRQQVTSKGGTTEKGLEILEQNHINILFEKVLAAAKNRAEILANQSGE